MRLSVSALLGSKVERQVVSLAGLFRIRTMSEGAHGDVNLVVGQALDHLPGAGRARDDDERLAAVLLGELEERRAEVLGNVADALQRAKQRRPAERRTATAAADDARGSVEVRGQRRPAQTAEGRRKRAGSARAHTRAKGGKQRTYERGHLEQR